MPVLTNPPATDGPLHLIAHVGHTRREHEHIIWWKPDSCGYTYCIDTAGLYSEAQASVICRVVSCIAVPKTAAEQLARSTPYYRRSDGTLNRLYDGEKLRVVPNALEAWKYLLAARLQDRTPPPKPTPISRTKARAIYIDGIQATTGAEL